MKLMLLISSFVVLAFVSLYVEMGPATANDPLPNLPLCGSEIERKTIQEIDGQHPGVGNPPCNPQAFYRARKRNKTTIYFQYGRKYYCTAYVAFDPPQCTTDNALDPCPPHGCTAP